MGPATEPRRTPQATENHSPYKHSDRTLHLAFGYKSRRSATERLGNPLRRRARHKRLRGIRSKHYPKSMKRAYMPGGRVPPDSISRCKMLKA